MKKKLIFLALCGALLVGGMTGCSKSTDQAVASSSQVVSGTSSSTSSSSTSTVKTAEDAKKKLQSGNAKYVTGSVSVNVSSSLREDLATNGQTPYAVVITCSDSRVPAELIFNSGLGELFVIRTAGNVVGDFEVGSAEYGAEHLGTPIIVVMGHTGCGAVTAAIDGHADGSIQDIVDEITPSVKTAKKETSDATELLNKAIELNVKNSISKLEKSEILHELESEGKVKIVGAIYDIDTGKVTFLDN